LIARFVIDGLVVDKEGVCSIQGKMDQFFKKEPLSDYIPSSKFPVLQMVLEQIIAQKGIVKQAPGPAVAATSGTAPTPPEPPFIATPKDELIAMFAAMLGTGRVDAHINGKATQISIEAPLGSAKSEEETEAKATGHLRVAGDEHSLSADVHARVQLKRTGSFVVDMEEKQGGLVESSLGDVELQKFRLHLGHDRSAEEAGRARDLEVSADLHLTAHHMEADVAAEGKTFAFQIPGKDDNVRAHLAMRRGLDGRLGLARGTMVKPKLSALLDSRRPIDLGAIQLLIRDGIVKIEGEAHLMKDRAGILVEDAKLNAHLEGSDPVIMIQGTPIAVEGSLLIDAALKGLLLDPSLRQYAGDGTFVLKLIPSDEAKKQIPGLTDIVYELKLKVTKEGRIEIVPDMAGISNFLRPLMGELDATDLVVDPTTAAAGVVGSAALEQRLCEVSHSRIVEGNHVEPLVDGVASFK
jgi:hypothetical protein